MKLNHLIILFIFVQGLLPVYTHSQTLSPVVINSTGGFYSSTWGNLSYSVGEPITTTISNSPILTQGFLQPLDSLQNALVISATRHSASCRGGVNGFGIMVGLKIFL